MPNFGYTLTLPGLQKAWGTNSTPSFSTYSGKTMLISFIEIDQGWDYLRQLKALYDDATSPFGYASIKSDINIVAVVFRYNGTTTRAEIGGKISTDSALNTLTDNPNFLILVDPDWNAASPTSCSNDNSGDFLGPLVAGMPNFHWSYLVARDGQTIGNANAVSDRWQFRTTGNSIESAFDNIVLTSGGQILTAIDEASGTTTLLPPPAAPLAFDSALARNSRLFFIQRMKNLLAPPMILSATPETGAYINDPADISTVLLFFSKPVDHVMASDEVNYSLTGDGRLGIPPLALSLALYNQLGNALNRVTLTLSGLISDTNADKNVVISGSNISDVFGIAPLPLDPMDNQTTFTVDITPPAIDAPNCTKDFAARTITVAFTEGVYANADGTGALQDADFTPTIHSAGATISNVHLTPHTAGSATAVFGFTATGTPDGSEYIVIQPANATSVFDIAGNPMAAAETTGTINMPDLTAPAAPSPTCGTPADDDTPTFTWAGVPGATQYRIRLNAAAPWQAAASPFTAPTPVPDGSYIASVQAGDTVPNWSSSGNAGYTIDTTTPPALPRDIVLALDYSGSMASPAVFNGVSKTKKQWIQDAADVFFNRLLSHISDQYRVGMVTYSTKALRALGLTGKAALEATPATFTTALASIPQGSTTAMGKAMAHSLDMIDYTAADATYGASRAIVLLADGQQNVDPYVTFASGTPPASLSIDTNLALADCPAGMGIATVSDHKIPVFTFGVGGNVPWLDDLVKISGVSGGTAGADGAIWPDLLTYFVGISPQLFPLASPQVVRNETASFHRNERRYFPINAGILKLTVCLSWIGAAPLRCALYKGSTTIYFDRITETADCYIGTVSFPHYQARRKFKAEARYTRLGKLESRKPGIGGLTMADPYFAVQGQKPKPGVDLSAAIRELIGARGDWSIVVEGKAGQIEPPEGYAFSLSVIVDEKHIKYRLDPFQHIVKPGNPLNLGMAFLKNGVALAVSPVVKASITHPVVDFDAALASNPQAVKKILEAAAAAGIDIKKESLRREVLARDPFIAGLLAKKVNSKLTLGYPIRACLGIRAPKNAKISKIFTDTVTRGPYCIEHAVRLDLGRNGVYERIIRDWAFIEP